MNGVSAGCFPEILEQSHAYELLQRQDALQMEAKEVIAELGILTSLARVGIPEQFGVPSQVSWFGEILILV